jgi:hypothetical protein
MLFFLPPHHFAAPALNSWIQPVILATVKFSASLGGMVIGDNKITSVHAARMGLDLLRGPKSGSCRPNPPPHAAPPRGPSFGPFLVSCFLYLWALFEAYLCLEVFCRVEEPSQRYFLPPIFSLFIARGLEISMARDIRSADSETSAAAARSEVNKCNNRPPVPHASPEYPAIGDHDCP